MLARAVASLAGVRVAPSAWLGSLRALSTTKEFSLKVPFETHRTCV